jgi:2'-5' RNA ligase
MRVFAALVPPEEVVEDLDEFLAVRREAGRFRWARPEQFHVTLAFAADLPVHRLDDLAEGLEAAAARRTPVTTRVAGGGAFPDAARARVLWAGLDLAPDGLAEVEALAAGARTAVARAGTPVDGTRFRPHLTLARLGRPQEVTRWVRLLDAYAGPQWAVTHVTLVASYLGEGDGRRPRYEELGRFPLTGRPHPAR